MAKLLAGSTIDGHLIWHDGSTDNRESALIYQTVAQNVISSAWDKVKLQTVKFDKLGGWDATNQKYIVQKGGIYFIVGAVNWMNSTTGVRSLLELRLNGSSYAWLTQEHSGANKNFSVTGTLVMECEAGDALELYTFHDATGGMDTTLIANGVGGISPSTFFNISKFA